MTMFMMLGVLFPGRFQLSVTCPAGSVGDMNVTYGLEDDDKSMSIYQLPNMVLKKYYHGACTCVCDV